MRRTRSPRWSRMYEDSGPQVIEEEDVSGSSESSEFISALMIARAEMFAQACDMASACVLNERAECAKLVEEWKGGEFTPESVSEAILNRIPRERQ